MKIELPKTARSTYSSFVGKSGTLVNDLKPAAFCDTSFLIDYSKSDIHNPKYANFPWNRKYPEDALFCEFLKADLRTRKIFKIREIVENFGNKLNLVYSPACRLELEEVLSETAFRNYGVEVSDIKDLQRRSRKEIGELLNRIRLRRNSDRNNVVLDNLYNYFFFMTMSSSELLPGLYEVDLVNIKITKNDILKFGFLANLQIGFADIFHLISASRLGCEYFFTLDGDFNRASSEIEKCLKLKVVSEIDTMVKLIKQ